MAASSGTYLTACPRNCYSTCSLQVTVEDGRLRRIEPAPANRATPGGACLKGLSYIERVYARDRLLHPLRRTVSGGFSRVSWDAALDEIADRLATVRATHGPRAVLFYAASGTKGLMNGLAADFWRLYGGCTTTYGDLCWPAGLEATRLTLGANEHNAPWDLANARLIVFWGKNAAETNLHQMAFVGEAQSRGAMLVVVDPRRTETAERAELLLQPRPGTDGALALALAHVLVARGWIDVPFIEAHVHGFEPYRERLRGCTPEWAAAITGVPIGAIHRLAELIGTTRPVTICAGFGMQRYTNSGQAMRAIIALLALTGNIGAPGAGWIFANLRTQVFGEKDPVAFYPPHHGADGAAPSTGSTGADGAAPSTHGDRAARSSPFRVSISTARLGPHMLATTDPPLRMAWVERGNPIPQNPETPAVIRAFRALDFRVVVDEALTDTAREADIVLPAKTFFEQTDVIGAYWHDYLQLRPRVIDPPGEVRPESAIYRELAARLGVSRAVIDETFPGDADASVEQYLARRLASVPGVTLEALRAGPVRMPDVAEVAFADRRFPTPSGRIELVSAEAAARWQVDPLPGYTEPVETVTPDGHDSARFPFVLLTPNSKNRIHSQFGHLPSLRAIDPAPLLHIHPEDAAERGIADGTRVRVFNDRGELTLAARLDYGLRLGCLVVHNGWWIADGGAVNLLSAARETDMGHGAAFHENVVNVEVAP